MLGNHCCVSKRAPLEALGVAIRVIRVSLSEPMEIELILKLWFFTNLKDPMEESSKL